MNSVQVSFAQIGILICSLSFAAFYSVPSHQAPDDLVDGVDSLVSSRTPVHVPKGSALDARNVALSGENGHPLDPLLKIARELKTHMKEEVRDYTATMVKQERIKGQLGEQSRMFLKVRNPRESPSDTTPLSAYIKFEQPSSTKGREVIWVEGRNENRLVSHEAGFLNLKRFNLKPDGMLAMMGNKYPVTEIGLLRLVEKLIEKGERDRAIGSCIVETIDGQRVGDRECRLYQVTHPEPVNGFDFHIAQIFVDVQRNIPLRYAAFLWPKDGEEPPLEEAYTYLDVQLNTGLTDDDFDPDNPDYNFP